MTDALCVAVQQPDTPANQARALAAIVKAISADAPATTTPPQRDASAVVIPKRMCGKTAC
jgi:hypothetical protein